VRRYEPVQARHEPPRREGGRSAHGQHAAAHVRAQTLDGLHETVETFTQLRQRCTCGVGQLERPVVTVKKLDSEIVLQHPDLVTHGRWSDVELYRRFFYAEVTCGGFERP
jgi:hypothetical protein